MKLKLKVSVSSTGNVPGFDLESTAQVAGPGNVGRGKVRGAARLQHPSLPWGLSCGPGGGMPVTADRDRDSDAGSRRRARHRPTRSDGRGCHQCSSFSEGACWDPGPDSIAPQGRRAHEAGASRKGPVRAAGGPWRCDRDPAGGDPHLRAAPPRGPGLTLAFSSCDVPFFWSDIWTQMRPGSRLRVGARGLNRRGHSDFRWRGAAGTCGPGLNDPG